MQDEGVKGENAGAVLLDVEGMKCGGCSAAVKRILEQQPGVRAASVNLLTNIAAVEVDGEAGDDRSAVAEAAAAAVTAKGFATTVRPVGRPISLAGGGGEDGSADAGAGLAVAWGLAAVCCVHHAGHLLHAAGAHGLAHGPVMSALGSAPVQAALGAAALLGPGRGLLVDGFKMLAAGSPNMNSLVSLGATTSFLGGVATAALPGVTSSSAFLEEPVMLLAVVLLGRNLEARARARATGDLRSLAELIPSQVRMLMDIGGKGSVPEVVEVPSSAVRVGDMVRVLPGERFPVDGTVVSGRSAADEAMLTGEPRLVAKQEGSAVTAGTINYEGPVDVRAEATGEDSVLAGIGRMVVEAQSREAPVARLADKIAGRFCYGVMGASFLTGLFWATAGAHLFPQALEAVPDAQPGLESLMLSLRLAIDVLVVACPCALGLATPTAVLVASSAGARQGLLIRGGDVLERLASVDTVVLDKTGTLTEGRMILSSTIPLAEGTDTRQVLALAAAVEANTNHPIAEAVLAAAEREGICPAGASSSVTVPGCGVTAMVDGTKVSVGTFEWVQEQTGSGALAGGEARGPSSSAETQVYVGCEGRGIIGEMCFADRLRADSAAAVSMLKSMGLSVHLFSGDNMRAVSEAASACGIDPGRIGAGMSPADKAAAVERLQSGGARVAMVGDGINDAPALAGAHVGVALHGGVEVATDVAGVVLMSDRVEQVADAVGLGRATLSKIKQNLGWALVYNLIGIPVAAGILLPGSGVSLDPSLAAGLMAGSSLAVISNSLLLQNHFHGRKER